MNIELLDYVKNDFVTYKIGNKEEQSAIDDYDLTDYAKIGLEKVFFPYQVEHIAQTIKKMMIEDEAANSIKQIAGDPRKYKAYFKDVSDLDEVDVYQVHQIFDIQDPSGCLHHASKKLLLPGVRTGGKERYQEIEEARDTLNRWLEINRKLRLDEE